MLPTYSDINKCLLTHFLESKTFCGYVVLTLNVDEAQKIFSGLNLDLIDVIHCVLNYWKKIAPLRPVDPKQAFGIIGIQSMAAYEHTLSGHKAVRKGIEHLLKIDTNDLSKLFKGEEKKKGQTFQDKLWNGAKAYLWETYQLEMDLPPPRKGFAHRFVQYPASQVLFTEKELKCFSRIFAEKQLLPESQISEERFRKEVFDNWKTHESYLLSSARKLLEDQPKKHLPLFKQLYQYFCDWDGIVYRLQFGGVQQVNELSLSRKLVAEFIDEQGVVA